MLNKLKQTVGFLNLPLVVLFMVVFVTFFGMIFVFKKYILTKSSKKKKNSAKNVINEDGNMKLLNRKKRNKKQRSIDVPRPVLKQVSATISNEQTVTTTATTVIKDEKLNVLSLENNQETEVNKRQDKRKSKSKKKKNENKENEVILTPAPVADHIFAKDGTGEWQTVRTKDQRLQRKDKKRQEEVVTTAAPKSNSPSPFAPTFPSLPSTAKDVAPRFARAAGEEWQDGATKRQATTDVTKSTTIVNRSPMIPAAAVQQQPSPKWSAPPAAPTVPDIWENKAPVSIGYSSAQNSTWSTNKTNVLAWNQGVNSDAWTSQSTTKTWDNAGNSVEKSDWSSESKSDDWVHVSTPSPTVVSANESWTTTPTIYPQAEWPDATTPVPDASDVSKSLIQRENFQMEPEGLSVTALAPADPWNMEDYERDDDWSPPEAHWSNSNDEWNVPVAPTKPAPTYFDESSDDDKAVLPAPISTTQGPQNVVGAGSDYLQNQQANKKSRRRRKKKQNPDNLEVAVTEPVQVATSMTDRGSIPAQDNAQTEVHIPEASVVDEAWSLSKAVKKKKARVRKAE